jgi:hypothetical protein
MYFGRQKNNKFLAPLFRAALFENLFLRLGRKVFSGSFEIRVAATLPSQLLQAAAILV